MTTGTKADETKTIPQNSKTVSVILRTMAFLASFFIQKGYKELIVSVSEATIRQTAKEVPLLEITERL